jgi:hypothetical protein
MLPRLHVIHRGGRAPHTAARGRRKQGTDTIREKHTAHA